MLLNPGQLEAVEHFQGPLLILAGAGSGKTRVITERIVRLLSRGVAPQSIVALTFTNKAAKEMHERVESAAEQRGFRGAAKALTVSTFHSFGLGVLSREQKSLGGSFTIFDQGDQVALVKELLNKIASGRPYDASAILARISQAKNAFIAPADLTEREGDEYDEITKLLYPRYQAALRNFRAYDFDDLVCEVARIFAERSDILERWRKRFSFILVDEYQDTNGAQLAVLKHLASEHKNICVVGDDDQSIYAWRGADVRNILEFEEQFVGAKVIKLEQNYRSKKPILDVANAVIEVRKDGRYRKVLSTDKVGGELPRLAVAPSPEAEAKWVAREIRRLTKDEGKKPREVAVLYRSNLQAKPVEEMLREQGVAYRVVGGQQFFERKEVKDILAYLKLALNRADEISLRRIANYPARGIGETSMERLSAHATGRGWTLWEAVERVEALDDISAAARDGCKALEKVVGTLRKRLLVDRALASDVGRELTETIGLRADLGQGSSAAVAARRWGNVESILGTFKRRETREAGLGKDATSERDLAAFLHALTLNFGEEEEDPKNVVTLSTLHGSKGLEFEYVFFLGCEEGLMPHSRTTDAKSTDVAPVAGVDTIEEERRLFYVGVTRAKELLTMSHCRHRVLRGKPAARVPSRFLADIPEALLMQVEIKEEAASMVEMSAGAEGLLAALLGE